MARDTRRTGDPPIHSKHEHGRDSDSDRDHDMFLDLAQDDRSQGAPSRDLIQAELSESAYQDILDRIARAPAFADRHRPSSSTARKSSALPQQRPSTSSTYHTPRNGRSRQSSVVDDRNSSRQADRATAHADSTSPVSAMAPSTVWDELDDLRSRLKRLEAHDTSVSIDSTSSRRGVKTRTATTAATTVSPPVSQIAQSALLSTGPTIDRTENYDGSAAILRLALARARDSLDTKLYRALETTAMDALTVSALGDALSPKDAVASAYSIISGEVDSQKELQQRASALCRSLAELCMHMCDTKDASTLLNPAPVGARSGQNSLPRRYPDASVSTLGYASRSQARFSSSRLSHLPRIGAAPLVADNFGSSSPRSPKDAKDYTARYTLESRRDSRSRFGLREADTLTALPDRSRSRAATEMAGSTPSARRRTIQGQDHLFTEPRRSPSLRDLLAERRVGITDGDLKEAGGVSHSRGDVYSPSVRPSSSFSRRLTLEPSNLRRQMSEVGESNRKTSRLSLLGRYHASTDPATQAEQTPDALRSGQFGAGRRPRPSTLLAGSASLSRVR